MSEKCLYVSMSKKLYVKKAFYDSPEELSQKA